MPPLTRTDTCTSIFSWWSDSNSLLRYGPTINLHTAAKPLIKFMYHRQALNFLRKNKDSPLSTEILEIYWSYLPWDLVSLATKAAILKELSDDNRRSFSEDEVQALVDSPGFPYIREMLGSPDTRTRILTCQLLHRLAQHEFTISPVLGVGGYEQLVALLDDQDDQVVQWATRALVTIAQWLKGAQAMVDAKVQDHILKLLKSQNSSVTFWTCWLVEELAGHKPIVPAILDLNLLKQLVGLAGESSVDAIGALHVISGWPEGAAALADLDVFEELQQVAREETFEYITQKLYTILDNITRYKAGKPDSAPEGVDS